MIYIDIYIMQTLLKITILLLITIIIIKIICDLKYNDMIKVIRYFYVDMKST